jgi:hypothetical protein
MAATTTSGVTGTIQFSSSPKLNIKVAYKTSRTGNSVSYELGIGITHVGGNGWYNNRIAVQPYINGSWGTSNVCVKKQTSGTLSTTTYWMSSYTQSNSDHKNQADPVYPIKGTTSVGMNATSFNVKIHIKGTGFGTGMTGKYSWGTPSADYGYESWSFDIPIGKAAGTVSKPTCSAEIIDIGTEKATVRAKITSNPSNWWRIHVYDVNGAWQNYTASNNTWTSYTNTGLLHNTDYNMYYQYTNSADGEGSGLIAVPFKTSGNAPTINSVKPTTTRTGANLADNNITYDRNAKFSSLSIKYGTTTNYGSTSTSTTIEKLSANTTYHYSMTVTDNFGRTSGAKTGSFKTLGNNPTIQTGHGLKTGGQTSVVMQYSATYDTNDALSSYKWEYGTTTSYGKNVTNTNSIGSLSTNTTYHYKLTVTGTQGRSSTATGTFVTDYATQQITNMSIQGVGEEFITARVVVPNTSWIGKVTCWVYEADGTTLRATQTKTSGITTNNDFTFEALDPGTAYIVKAQIVTAGRYANYNSNIISTEAETLDASPVIIVDANGTMEKHKMYVMGSGNIFSPMKMSWQNGYYKTGSVGDNISTLLNINEGACATRGIAVIPNISYTIKNIEDGMTYIVHGTDESGVVTETGYTVTSGNSYTFTTATNTTRLWISATSNIEPINHQTVQYYKLNIFRTIEKTVIPKENIVYVNGKIRYIDILSAGSTANNPTQIVELKVFNTAGENIALGKPVEIVKGIPEADAYGNTARVTDGDTDSQNYLGITPKTPLNLETCVRVDLGREYTDISHVTLWRYYRDGRTYYNTRILGRDGQKRLSWKFHSYKSQGTYPETAEGHTFYMTRQEIVHIPYINSIIIDPDGSPTLIGTNIILDAEPMVFMPEVIDSLTSYRIDAILAANQGRLLKQDVGQLEELTTEENASIVEAINEIWMDFNETSDYTNALNAILNAPLMI